jgi:uncharacterized protein (TIGR02001 family)
MKKYMASIGLAFGLGALAVSSAPAMAEEKSGFPGSFSANISLTSEYYFRGLSQTDDAPAIQGGFDYEVPLGKPVALYLGVWGSNVDFNEAAGVDGATIEIDYYGGLRGSIGDTGVSWDVGFIYYTYPGADSSLDYDFIEAQAALGYDFGVASVTASINYSPENFGESGTAFYPKLAVEVPVSGIKDLTLSGHVAKQYIDKEAVFGSPDYVEWNFGIGYSVAGFDLAVNYTDTDISPSADANDAMVLFTVGRSF